LVAADTNEILLYRQRVSFIRNRADVFHFSIPGVPSAAILRWVRSYHRLFQPSPAKPPKA
jgi:hypothetical protein